MIKWSLLPVCPFSDGAARIAGWSNLTKPTTSAPSLLYMNLIDTYHIDNDPWLGRGRDVSCLTGTRLCHALTTTWPLLCHTLTTSLPRSDHHLTTSWPGNCPDTYSSRTRMIRDTAILIWIYVSIAPSHCILLWQVKCTHFCLGCPNSLAV